MELKKIFAATAVSLLVVVLQAAPVIAGAFQSNGVIVSSGPGTVNSILPGPGVLGLVAAVIVGTIFLARRGK